MFGPDSPTKARRVLHQLSHGVAAARTGSVEATVEALAPSHAEKILERTIATIEKESGRPLAAKKFETRSRPSPPPSAASTSTSNHAGTGFVVKDGVILTEPSRTAGSGEAGRAPAVGPSRGFRLSPTMPIPVRAESRDSRSAKESCSQVRSR
jgi:hypothetical protein